MSAVKPLPLVVVLLFGELIVTSLSSRNGFLDTGRMLPLFVGLVPAGAGEVARLRKGLLDARFAGCKLFGEGCRSVYAKKRIVVSSCDCRVGEFVKQEMFGQETHQRSALLGSRQP